MSDRAQTRRAAKAQERAVVLATLNDAIVTLLSAERRRRREQRPPGEMTFTQVMALQIFDTEDQVTTGEIATSAVMTLSNVTQMLDQLEAGGFVTRQQGLEDRRVRFVSLTDKGREALARRRAEWRRIWDSELAHLSIDELNAASRTIQAMTKVTEQLS